MARYRITVFDKARTQWRERSEHAMRDAIQLALASWDEEAREHYLAVPVSMETDHMEVGGSGQSL